MYNMYTMGDGTLICPAQVHKAIPPPPAVSWVYRDQKLNVEHGYIGFITAFFKKFKYQKK